MLTACLCCSQSVVHVYVFSLFGELKSGVMVPYSRREQNKIFAAIYTNLQCDSQEVSTYV